MNDDDELTPTPPIPGVAAPHSNALIKGRSTRTTWWIVNILLLIASLFVSAAAYPSVGESAFQMLLVIPATVVDVRRLNDCKRPSAYGYALGAASLLLIVALYGLETSGAQNATDIGFLLVIMILPLWIAVIVMCGFFRSK